MQTYPIYSWLYDLQMEMNRHTFCIIYTEIKALQEIKYMEIKSGFLVKYLVKNVQAVDNVYPVVYEPAHHFPYRSHYSS